MGRTVHGRRLLTMALDAVLLLLLAAVLFVGHGQLPNAWYRVVVVAGGSMEPTLAPGDLMVVAPAPQVVEPGMIVVLAVDDRLITHRVTTVHPDGTFDTKGDANPVADDFTGRDVRVYGEYAWTVPLPVVGPAAGATADERHGVVGTARRAPFGLAVRLLSQLLDSSDGRRADDPRGHHLWLPRAGRLGAISLAVHTTTQTVLTNPRSRRRLGRC